MATIRDIGEQGLLEQLRKILDRHTQDLPLGSGDDVAITPSQSTSGRMVWTIDTMVEGTHFRFWEGLPDAEWLGNRLAVANLSDLASKGARPLYGLLSLALPGDADPDVVEEVYHGLDRALETAGARLVGGDTVLAPQWTLSLALTGVLDDDQAITARANARPGQHVYVTGRPGESGAAIKLLEEGRYLNGSNHLHPLVRDVLYSPLRTLGPGRVITRRDPHAAMLDISDGIVKDAGRIASASGVRVVLERERFDLCERLISVAGNQGWSALDLYLHGGEDFELLFTSSLTWEDLESAFEAESIPGQFTCIGRVEEGAGVALQHGNGEQEDLTPGGFEHFT